jgi:probable rRNA maturation factor
MVEFDFKNKTKTAVDDRHLRKIAETFSDNFYPGKDIQISATIVGMSEIITLNKKFFRKNSPTDVISIETGIDAKPLSLGEIVICADVVSDEAKKLNHSLAYEIETLFKHGLIHLLGKEHKSYQEKKVWSKLLAKFERKL